MLQVLKRAFPSPTNNRSRIAAALFFGLFVFLFLLLFRPFGLSEIKSNIWWITIGYGAITMVVVFLMIFLAPRLSLSFFKESNWTVGKEISYTLLIILFIAVSNLIYSVWLGFFNLDLVHLLYFIIITLAVGIIPVSIQVLIRQNRLYKKYAESSTRLNDTLQQEKRVKDETIIICNEEGKLELELKENHIYLMAASDNYVEVFYLKENKIEKKLVRNTLLVFERQFKGAIHFFRCHRSYIVNLHQVQKTSGNAQGYRLVLHPELPRIPVSRRKTNEFKERIKSLKFST